MTREKAINVLEDALSRAVFMDDIDVLEMAISALREQEEYEGLKNSYAQLQASFDQIYDSNMNMGVVIKHLREKEEKEPCAWCFRFAKDRQYLLSEGNGMYKDAVFEFCPMCGRRLEEA